MNMRELQKMQQRLVKMQEELANALFAGTAGGGAVTVTANGKFEVTEVKIDPEAFSPEEIGDLEVMVMAAFNDALGKVNEAQSRLATNAAGGLKIPGLF